MERVRLCLQYPKRLKSEKDREALVAIEIDDYCELFNCLPQPGGLFDQDSTLLYKLAIVRRVKSELRAKSADPRK